MTDWRAGQSCAWRCANYVCHSALTFCPILNEGGQRNMELPWVIYDTETRAAALWNHPPLIGDHFSSPQIWYYFKWVGIKVHCVRTEQFSARLIKIQIFIGAWLIVTNRVLCNGYICCHGNYGFSQWSFKTWKKKLSWAVEGLFITTWESKWGKERNRNVVVLNGSQVFQNE